MKVNDKVVVVTGGSTGIGKAIVKLFRQRGAKIAIFDLKTPDFPIDNVLFFKGNISSCDSLTDFYKLVGEKLGAIDVVVANAGIGYGAHVKKVSEAKFDKVVDTNFKGTFFTVQKSLSYLKDGGSVIMIASTAGHCAMESHSVYSASKAAVIQLGKNFAIDLGNRNIRVNTISPSFIDTNILSTLKKAMPEALDVLAEEVPLGKRLATPDEVASLALFLASDESKYITGEDFKIDGGVTIQYKKLKS